ncbi:hypothetical protein ACFO1B_25595 [Dactylosporangium siamense]|uniref:Uncharacterized protein n=1 Tax=Dactylosporangium siamense TaxID=685454 RepID=A0A919PM55_9ACTN|nr:hypothetical protein [Dactylosporangium siamense]GIG47325.1 hypothetical protein Dsi01nite_053660 [Dactylosporangium siamense]
MTDIETRLARSLTARADRPVEVDGLARLAMTRAGRIRARHRVVTGAAVAVLVVAGVVGVRALLPERKDTTLPVALGIPSAASRPEAIGTDPGLLHFDVDVRAFGVPPAFTVWGSAEDHESVSVYASDNSLIAAVYLAPTASDLKRALRPLSSTAVDTTVGGRPAKADTFEVGAGDPAVRYTDLRWEPRDGIFAAVWAPDRASAAKAFDAVRLDRAQRCVTPMRLSELPAGGRWTECETAVRAGPVPGRPGWRWSSLTVQQVDGIRVQLWAAAEHDVAEFKPDRVVAGYPAQWVTEGMRGLWMPEFGPVSLYVGERDAFHADLISEEQAVWYVQRVQIFEDLTNPAAWPTTITR